MCAVAWSTPFIVHFFGFQVINLMHAYLALCVGCLHTLAMYMMHSVSIFGTKTSQMCACDDAVNRLLINMPHIHHIYMMFGSAACIIVWHILLPCVCRMSQNEFTKDIVK